MTAAPQTPVQEKAPPGFEHVVKALKGKPGINPYAVSWSMKNKGYGTHSQEGKRYDPAALLRRHLFDEAKKPKLGSGTRFSNLKRSLAHRKDVTNPGALAAWIGDKAHGANNMAKWSAKGRQADAGITAPVESVGGLGAFLRKGVKTGGLECRESDRPAPRDLGWFTPLREAAFAAGDHPVSARVVLITEGPGNKTDKNFYPASALQKSFQIFEGKKCFLNHPSRSEEEDRPERAVQEMCGWFANTELGALGDRAAVMADLMFGANAAGDEARRLIESALQYQKQFQNTDDVLVGFSINASGPSHEELINGESWNVVDLIESAFSADLVTFPARGGKALALREAEAAMLAARFRFRASFDAELASARFRAGFRQELAHAA